MRTEEENKLPENIQQHLIKLESKTKINNDELSQIRKDVQAASDSYEICICGFSTKPAALRRKSKDWLTRNQDSVSEWGDMLIRELLFQ
jgi:hypothetical protein